MLNCLLTSFLHFIDTNKYAEEITQCVYFLNQFQIGQNILFDRLIFFAYNLYISQSRSFDP